MPMIDRRPGHLWWMATGRAFRGGEIGLTGGEVGLMGGERKKCQIINRISQVRSRSGSSNTPE